jgi:long-subunit acyl-CoA synthetase (AMP-forming)
VVQKLFPLHIAFLLQGVLLSHGAVVATIASQLAFEFSVPGGGISSDDCYFSFLPLAHIFDRLSIISNLSFFLFFSYQFFFFSRSSMFVS